MKSGGCGGWGGGGGGVKYGVFTSASIFFFAKRSMVSESNAYYTDRDRDSLLYMYSTFQVSHINSFNFYYCVLAF